MLYLTNVGELAGCYSYINLGVNVYEAVSSGAWASTASNVTATDGNLNYFVTLSNGYVSFILSAPTGTGYVLSIDEGSWYCIDGSPGVGQDR